MAHHPAPLKFLFPGWYAVVMGLCGLSLAWYGAQPAMGPMAGSVALLVGALAAGVFGVLAVATVLRGMRHPEAWAEDRRHPVRHTFIAALPIALLLLATVAVALFGPAAWAAWLWWAGSLAQLFVTVWVLARWWRGNTAGGLQWPGVTPMLFLPVVGNVIAPLAGVPLGQPQWSAAQFGIGLLFWPVVLVLLTVRIAVHGMVAPRLLPTLFIALAPPAVVGLAVLQLGAPMLVGWGLWGVGLFTLLWVGTQARQIAALPFALPHWGMSFPLTAFTALTLRLGTLGTPLAVLGPVLLSLSSLLILWLSLATLRGLRDGSLLAPEPVAAIVPAQA